MDNCKRISNGIYIVRTQAGFNKALVQEAGTTEGVIDYPTAYPALVSITVGYRGYHYPQVTYVAVNALREVLKGV